MKKGFLIVMLIMMAGQAISQYGNLRASEVTGDSIVKIPLDTLSRAKNGSIAIKNGVYYYKWGYWKLIGSTTKALSGTSLSGDTVLLGGSSLDRYTPIATGSYPLTVIANGINAATQTDSNSVRFINNTAAATSTDSNTTPALLWHVNGRKTLGGAASWPVDFSLDAVGLSGGSTTSALLRLRSKINNGTYATIFSINSAGTITSPLKIGSSRLGELSGTSVFFGNNALNTNSGADIVAIGTSSNAATTIGQRNVGAGTNTLALNQIGEECTAIGYNAMQANDTNYNTAVGAWSLYSTTKGFANAAFGKNAGWLNTTGLKNLFAGTAAGENNTTGSFNSWAGMDAGLQNTTGNENSAQGWNGGSQNRTGSYNSWFGSSSGRGIYHGNYNVGIGRDAQYLGYAAGEYIQNDTVDNSIAIGAGVNTNKSNQMILGNVGITETKIRGSIYATDTTGITLLGQRSDSALVRLPSGLWGGGGGSIPTIQQVLTAGSTTTMNNTIVNGANTLGITNNSLAGYAGLKLTSNSTAAASNEQTLLGIELSGVNANTAESTYGAKILNQHTGSFSNNYGLEVRAFDGESSNIAIHAMASGTGADNIALQLGGQSTTGRMRIHGSTSGAITIQPASAAGTYTLTLPTTDGNSGEFLQTDGSGVLSWAASGSGTVNSGTANRLTYYSTTGTAVSELAAITANRAVISDANGLPTHSAVTTTELGYVSGVTSAIQTQFNNKYSINGNSLTSGDWIGSSNATSFRVRTNNTERFRIDSTTGNALFTGTLHSNGNLSTTGNVIANNGNTTFFGSSLSNVGYVNGPITISPLQELRFSPGNAEQWRVNTSANGGTLTNTAGVGSAAVHVRKTTEQLRLDYDASNYFSTTVGSTGGVTFNAIGSGSSFAFSDKVTIPAGSSTAKVGGSFTPVTTTVGNVGTGEDNLQTFSVPAGTLAADGDYLEFEMTFFANASGATIKVYWGATQLGSITTNSSFPVTTVKGKVVRTGATSQRISWEYTSQNNVVVPGYTTASETLSGSVTIKGTGEGTSNDDVTQVLLFVGYE